MKNWNSKLRNQHILQHQKIKYLGISLAKYVKNIYNNRYKTLFKENWERERDHIHGSASFIPTMSVLSNNTHTFNTIPIKIPRDKEIK